MALEKILFHLDLLSVDLAGHYASAISFFDGKYHRFNDQYFSGYIHGLFYPPLEDWILSVWFKVCSVFSVGPRAGFPSYLILVFGLYLVSQWRFVMRWSRGWKRNSLAAFLVFMDLVPKIGETTIQGLSLHDFWVTGLTSQVLSGIFFFRFLSGIMFHGGSASLLLWFSLTFASHVVLGLSATLLLVFVMVFEPGRRRDLLFVSAGAAALTAFFWLPFLAHREFLQNTTVYSSEHPMWSFSLLSVAMIMFHRKRRLDLALTFFSLLIFLCAGLLPVLIRWSPEVLQEWVPGFHYYRLSVVGVMILGFVVFRLDWRIARVAILLFVLCLGLNFQNFTYGAPDPLEPAILDLRDAGDLSLGQGGRYWVVGRSRPIDFSLDVLLASEHKDFKSNKGLFWESSSSNTLLSSYLVTLLSLPSVLPYFSYWGLPCRVLGCFLDSYFRTFNIQGVIGSPINARYNLGESKIGCYRDLFEQGTAQYMFHRTGVIKAYGEEYPIHKLVPKENATTIQMSLGESIPFDHLGRLPLRKPGFQDWEKAALTEVYQNCRTGSGLPGPLKIWVKDGDWEEIESVRRMVSINAEFPEREVAVDKLGEGRYQITIPKGAGPSFYVIKFAAQPGMRFTGEDGEKVRHWSTFPHTLIFGKGRIQLEILETIPMKAGRWISIVTAFAMTLFLFAGRFSRNKTRRDCTRSVLPQ